MRTTTINIFLTLLFFCCIAKLNAQTELSNLNIGPLQFKTQSDSIGNEGIFTARKPLIAYIYTSNPDIIDLHLVLSICSLNIEVDTGGRTNRSVETIFDDTIAFPLFALEKQLKGIYKRSYIAKNIYSLSFFPEPYPSYDAAYDSLANLLFRGKEFNGNNTMLISYAALEIPKIRGVFNLDFDADSEKFKEQRKRYDDRKAMALLLAQIDSLQKEITRLDNKRKQLWEHVQDYRDSLFKQQESFDKLPSRQREFLEMLIKSWNDCIFMEETILNGQRDFSSRLDDLVVKHKAYLLKTEGHKDFPKVKSYWEAYLTVSKKRMEYFRQLAPIQQEIVRLRNKQRELELWVY